MLSPGKWNGLELHSIHAMMPAGVSISIEYTASLCGIHFGIPMHGVFGRLLILIIYEKLPSHSSAHTTLAPSAPRPTPEDIKVVACWKQIGSRKHPTSFLRL